MYLEFLVWNIFSACQHFCNVFRFTELYKHRPELILVQPYCSDKIQYSNLLTFHPCWIPLSLIRVTDRMEPIPTGQGTDGVHPGVVTSRKADTDNYLNSHLRVFNSAKWKVSETYEEHPDKHRSNIQTSKREGRSPDSKPRPLNCGPSSVQLGQEGGKKANRKKAQLQNKRDLIPQ